MALFLNPRFKSLKGLTEPQKRKCMDKVSDFVGDDGQPPAKKQNVDAGASHFSDFEDDGEDDLAEEGGEIARYTKIKYDNSLSIAEFWRQKEAELPKLARYARQVIAITPSSAPSERAFSLAGYVCSARRTSLKHGSVNDNLLLNSKFKTDS